MLSADGSKLFVSTRTLQSVAVVGLGKKMSVLGWVPLPDHFVAMGGSGGKLAAATISAAIATPNAEKPFRYFTKIHIFAETDFVAR